MRAERACSRAGPKGPIEGGSLAERAGVQGGAATEARGVPSSTRWWAPEAARAAARVEADGTAPPPRRSHAWTNSPRQGSKRPAVAALQRRAAPRSSTVGADSSTQPPSAACSRDSSLVGRHVDSRCSVASTSRAAASLARRATARPGASTSIRRPVPMAPSRRSMRAGSWAVLCAPCGEALASCSGTRARSGRSMGRRRREGRSGGRSSRCFSRQNEVVARGAGGPRSSRDDIETQSQLQPSIPPDLALNLARGTPAGLRRAWTQVPCCRAGRGGRGAPPGRGRRLRGAPGPARGPLRPCRGPSTPRAGPPALRASGPSAPLRCGRAMRGSARACRTPRRDRPSRRPSVAAAPPPRALC